MNRPIPLEWPASLDVDELIGSGWRPAPFNEFVLKLHSRCDLACRYCYVYAMDDQGWRRQPTTMSPEVIGQAARRIADHATAHAIGLVRLILHGGEPLLAGPERLRLAAREMRAALPADAALSIILQTNGMHLSEANLALLAELSIGVGVSLDGTQADHDRTRIRPGGQGSYARIECGLERLAATPYRHLFRGLLCTIDLASDPLATYAALRRFSPPAIDFLLPHGNWTRPAPGLAPGSVGTPYADWLLAIFEHWYEERSETVRIRLFDQIMTGLLTGRMTMEGLGPQPARIVVIETDGSLEQADHLKSAYDGAAVTGLHVLTDPLDAALQLPSIAARQIGMAGLCAQCRSCRIRSVCGGGHYGHRYRAGSGFLNPSVYCADLMKLISRIADRVGRDLVRLRSTC